MGGKYAEGTSVTPQRSQAEIQEMLSRYGANAFMGAFERDEDGEKAMIAFRAHGRTIRFVLPMPEPNDPEFTRTPSGRVRPDPEPAYRAEIRRRWRALTLAIKAKLEAVETGIASFEDEFLAYTVLPDNTTVAETLQPRLTAAITQGTMPRRLLPQIEAREA